MKPSCGISIIRSCFILVLSCVLPVLAHAANPVSPGPDLAHAVVASGVQGNAWLDGLDDDDEDDDEDDEWQ